MKLRQRTCQGYSPSGAYQELRLKADVLGNVVCGYKPLNRESTLPTFGEERRRGRGEEKKMKTEEEMGMEGEMEMGMEEGYPVCWETREQAPGGRFFQDVNGLVSRTL